MEKIAIIEINENDLKLLILDVKDGVYYNVYDRICENLGLGNIVKENGIILSSKIIETLSVLKMFRKVCDNNKVEKVLCFSTSFIKESKNQKSFFDEIYNNTAFSFTVLNHEDEVRTVYNGVVNSVDVPKGVIINVEPYKTNIIQYNRRTLINLHTIDFGAMTFVENKTSYTEIIEKVKKEVKSIKFLKLLEEDVSYVGCGSIITSIGKLARKAMHYPLDVDNNFILSKNIFDKVFDKVKDLDLDKTSKLKGISEDRADSFVQGMAIVKGLLDSMGIEDLTISSGDLEQGLIYSNIVPTANEKPLGDMLNYSLETIRHFYDIENANNENVYNLAIILYKQLKVMHKLPRMYVKALRIAASMYDCGKRINFNNNCNNSFEIIVKSNINGVSHKDLLLAGFACKLQNLDNFVLADWVKYAQMLNETDLDAVRKLGVIVNLAVALDRSKSGNITDICCDILGDSIIMKTVVKNDATFDIRQGMKVKGDFKKVLKKHLQII